MADIVTVGIGLDSSRLSQGTRQAEMELNRLISAQKRVDEASTRTASTLGSTSGATAKAMNAEAQAAEQAAVQVDLLRDRFTSLQQQYRLGIIGAGEYGGALRTLKADIASLAQTTEMGAAAQGILAGVGGSAAGALNSLAGAGLRSDREMRHMNMGLIGLSMGLSQMASGADHGKIKLESMLGAMLWLSMGSPALMPIIAGAAAVAAAMQTIKTAADDATEAFKEMGKISHEALGGRLAVVNAQIKQLQAQGASPVDNRPGGVGGAIAQFLRYGLKGAPAEPMAGGRTLAQLWEEEQLLNAAFAATKPTQGPRARRPSNIGERLDTRIATQWDTAMDRQLGQESAWEMAELRRVQRLSAGMHRGQDAGQYTRPVLSGVDITGMQAALRQEPIPRQAMLDTHKWLTSDAEVFKSQWDKSLGSVEDRFTQLFRGLMTNGVASFKQFTDMIIGVWEDAMARMLANRFMQTFGLDDFAQGSGVAKVKPLSFGGKTQSALAAPGDVYHSTVNLNVSAIDQRGVHQFVRDNQQLFGAAALAAAGNSRAILKGLRG